MFIGWVPGAIGDPVTAACARGGNDDTGDTTPCEPCDGGDVPLACCCWCCTRCGDELSPTSAGFAAMKPDTRRPKLIGFCGDDDKPIKHERMLKSIPTVAT
jgi:hypothetical protein